jgi:hypothetical protein
MQLANALSLKTKDVGFIISEVNGLQAWYKYKSGISVDSGNVSGWIDSSGNTSVNMNLNPTADVPYNSTTGALNFNTTDGGTLATSSDQLNLGAFTIFGVVDVVEAGATNEAVLGRAGNDEFRLFRGENAANVRLRANGVNYDINMSSNLPTGKFLFTLTRASGGLITIFINGVSKGTVASDVTDLFDFTRIGNGNTDSLVFEIAIYNVELSSADISKVEANINSRNGL